MCLRSRDPFHLGVGSGNENKDHACRQNQNGAPTHLGLSALCDRYSDDNYSGRGGRGKEEMRPCVKCVCSHV